MKDPFSQSFKSKLELTGQRPDLTPFFGLFFLLLLFFMLGSSFVQVSGLKVELPDVGAQSVIGVEKYVITVAHTPAGPEISFNDRLVNMEALSQELVIAAGHSRTATVIICADKNIPVDVLTKIMALAEQARLNSFIATLPQRNDRKEAIFEQNY